MKNFTKIGLAMLMASVVALPSCSKDDDNNGNGNALNGVYSKTQFLAYTQGVTYELKSTAAALSDAWTDGYSDEFKAGDAGEALQFLKEGMLGIANEVHAAKIGEPYEAGDVYGVESWYSFNSFTDYRDNLYSIQNVFFGKVLTEGDAARENMALPTSGASLAATVSNNVAINNAINTALVAINDLIDAGTPFRDYVLDMEAGTPSAKIADLIVKITAVEKSIDGMSVSSIDKVEGAAIVNQFVDGVVEPTYGALKSEAATLYAKVDAYCKTPTQANLDAAAVQWKVTRRPWEQSEAFLFGPVDTEGYDPHLDSWPLSQSLINDILKQTLFPSIENVGTIYRDEVLGFHAIEYVLFKAGSVRNVEELFDGEKVNIEGTNEM